jgi:2-polyprenyl-3-methyl-5-hydroxy-6-metoxy-1,4-benzoquinol methylase
MSQWYQELFKNYSNKYDNELFTQGTKGEVDFIEKEINFKKSTLILDIGCGTGRHAIELAQRGYSVTGIDLSEDQLSRAKSKAMKAGVDVNFELHDARDFSFPNRYNLAIMICEGAFPLMETDEMNFQILTNAYESIAPGGKFIFTTLNGLFPLFRSVNEFHAQDAVEGNATYHSYNFDLMTFRDYNITKFVDDSGVEKELECNERYYMPSEITWMLKTLGFANIEMFGAKLGAFSREDRLTPDDFEMLVIAEKEA